MRVLVCHNYYTTRAGEERVVEEESRLLREHGHEVRLFTANNAEAETDTLPQKARLALNAVHSRTTRERLAALVDEWRPDVAHVHNTWFQLSPALYLELHARRIPIVQTLHNYRWLCASASLYRDGHICHDCLEKPGGRLHAVVHRCYHDSTIMSATLAATQLYARRLRRIYDRLIDRIIVQTDFVRDLFVQQGFDPARLVVKPNFMYPISGTVERPGTGFVFTGRLDVTKGIRTLLEAAHRIDAPISVFGGGPLEAEARAAADRLPHVTFHGLQPHAVVIEALRGARAVVIPSEWYESFPMTFVEAMALGKPVIASDLGSLGSLVRADETGLLVPPGDPGALAGALRRLHEDDALACQMGDEALRTYHEHLTPDINYARLMQVYDGVR